MTLFTSMEMRLANGCGLLGALMVLGAYGLLQIHHLKADGVGYSLLNAAGAALILVSLIYDWNLAAFITEGAWLALSLAGLVKSLIKTSSRRAKIKGL